MFINKLVLHVISKQALLNLGTVRFHERTYMCVILYCAAVRFTSTIISNMKVGQADRWSVVLIGELEVNEVQRSENVSLKITRTICT